MGTMNWSDLYNDSEEAFKPLESGVYNVEVASSKYQEASTGKPMFVVMFKVIDGPSAGRTVWNNFVVTKDNPNAMVWFFRHMDALGLGKSFFASNPTNEQIADHLMGKRAQIEVKKAFRAGAERSDVTSIKPMSGPTGPPPPEAAPPAPAPPQQEQPAPAPPTSPTPPQRPDDAPF